ncbi:hypothetical protein [Promicromonospora sp. NFX87]|uniref:hypothetical protein n=1 Tax=Promicromonospora sp. NFX87 TaxID=3402691 RepID=UPI003AFA3F41
MIGILNWDIRALDTTLPVTAGSINIDDQNRVAIMASVSVPFDETLFEGLDPRQTPVPRVKLNGTLTQWYSLPVSAMSTQATTAGGTLADLTIAWAGLEVRDVSAMFGGPLDPTAIDNDQLQAMSLDLHVREIKTDDFEMVIELASDEALLQDWSATSSNDTDAFLEIRSGMDETEILAWVDPVLRVVLGYGLDPTVYDTTSLSVPYSDLLTPIRETNALDYLRPFLEDTDLKLRVNPSGRGFTLQRPENYINNPAHHSWLFLEDDVISAKRVVTRSGEWYDSVELHRPSTEGNSYGYPTSGTHSRTYLESWAGRKPSSSMAQNIWRRTKNRGRFIDLVVPIHLGVFMRDEFTYLPTGATPGPDYQWAVKSVTYDLVAGTMSIRGEQRY